MFQKEPGPTKQLGDFLAWKEPWHTYSRGWFRPRRKIIKRYEIQQRARYMCSFCGKEISSGLQPLQISKSQAVSESCLCSGMSVLCWIPSICCLGVCVVSRITTSYTDEFLRQAKFRDNPGWGSTRSHQSPVIQDFRREIHRYSILHYMMILAGLHDVIRKYIYMYIHI